MTARMVRLDDDDADSPGEEVRASGDSDGRPDVEREQLGEEYVRGYCDAIAVAQQHAKLRAQREQRQVDADKLRRRQALLNLAALWCGWQVGSLISDEIDRRCKR